MNTKQTSLFSNKGHEIPIFDKNIDYFLNRSIMLYGASNSGKSTIIRDILYSLKKHIPNVCVICPTNKLNGSYDGFIPKPLIHSDVSENLLNDILKRQLLNVKIYNLANDKSKLKDLYSHMIERKDNDLNKMIKAYEAVKNNIENNMSLSDTEKKNQIHILEKEHNKNIIYFYQKIIHSNVKHISKLNLSESDKTIVRHVNNNPNFLIIIDDAAVSASTWCKYESVKELFFNGRHHRVTFMIAFQDDKLLDSGLRKNAFINIFTTETVCTAYFKRPANNFSAQEKKYMEDLADTVFNNKKGDNSKNYRKLVYLRESTPPCKYMVADIVEDFIFGSKYLIKYCSQVSKDEKEINFLEFEDFF